MFVLIVIELLQLNAPYIYMIVTDVDKIHMPNLILSIFHILVPRPMGFITVSYELVPMANMV